MFSDPTATAKTAPPIDPVLLERLHKMVEEVSEKYHYRLTSAQMSREAAELYDDLVARITDAEEIDAVIAHIKHLYSKCLKETAPENSRSNVA